MSTNFKDLKTYIEGLIVSFFSMENSQAFRIPDDHSSEYIASIKGAQDGNALLEQLVDMYSLMIEVMNQDDSDNNYYTDHYKSVIRNFSFKLLAPLEQIFRFSSNENLRIAVLGIPFISYAIYKSDVEVYRRFTNIGESNTRIHTLYLALNDYFKVTTYKFSDNTEAIDLMVGRYPENLNFQDETLENIASTLHTHFLYCGEGRELGKLFYGIDRISEKIHKLPIILIEKIIRFYQVSEVHNNERQRQQIHTLLSPFSEEDRRQKKFTYLDGLFLVDLLSNAIINNRVAIGLFYFNDIRYRYGDQVINIDDIYSWRVNEEGFRFLRNKQEIVRFYLEGDSIYIRQLNNDMIIIPFDLDDWQLAEISSVLFRENLTTNLNTNTIASQFFLSYVYLENFNSIKNTAISLDHRFDYSVQRNILKKAVHPLPQFYGGNIDSVTCLVGRNGAGKTSFISFIKDFLLKYIQFIERYKSQPTENGYIDIRNDFNFDDRSPEMAWMKEKEKTKFIVVFKIDEQDYILTNKDIEIESQIEEICAYETGLFQQNDEGWKIFNFCNSINIYQSLGQISGKLVFSNDQMYIDYSEQAELEKLFREEQSSIKKVVKIFLEMMFEQAFLNKETQEDNTFHKAIIGIFEEYQNSFNILKDTGKAQLSDLDIDVLLSNLSSGQLAKLIFLSKLYWSLSSEITDSEISYPKMKDDEYSIIFIDEGDLYYHPEWQRQYLFILIALLTKEKHKRFQLILSTNSPFIISDLLEEDIVYLPNKQEKSLTFGQNIHTLLSEKFFMENTMGQFAIGKIEAIIKALSLLEQDSKPHHKIYSVLGLSSNDQLSDVFNYLRSVIERVGENIYRTQLLELLEKLENHYQINDKIGKRNKLANLRNQVEVLERELEQ